MPDHPIQLDSINYRRVFPWVHLFRAFWIAADIRKLTLACLALLAISAGDMIFDQLPFSGQALNSSEVQVVPVQRWPWEQTLGYPPGTEEPLTQIRGFLIAPGTTLSTIGSNWQVALRPINILIEPAAGLFRADASWAKLAYDMTRLVWALIIWSLFGGAIGRISAVQFARDQKISIRSALAFASTRFFSYLAAPILPLLGVGFLWAILALGGLVGRIPGVGEIVVGVLWGIGLIFGFLMALVLVGVAAGWPLMFATINVEATDGFDGLSRACNYVFERPWHYLWYAIVAMMYGSFVIFFVWLMGQLAVYLTGWSVAWGMGYDATAHLFAHAPRLVGGNMALPNLAPNAPVHTWGAVLVGGWLRVVALLIVGFVYSYFWSATTIIYFLLRKSVDSNDLEEVYLEEEDEPDNLLPLVGTAATGMPVLDPATVSVTPASAAVPGTPAPPVDLAP